MYEYWKNSIEENGLDAILKAFTGQLLCKAAKEIPSAKVSHLISSYKHRRQKMVRLSNAA
jgi:hypothetical protein